MIPKQITVTKLLIPFRKLENPRRQIHPKDVLIRSLLEMRPPIVSPFSVFFMYLSVTYEYMVFFINAPIVKEINVITLCKTESYKAIFNVYYL